MDPRLYSSEEISLNYKLGQQMKILDPKVFVFYSDRNFKHFLAKDFLWFNQYIFNKIPMKRVFYLFASSFPTLFVLSFPMVFIISF